MAEPLEFDIEFRADSASAEAALGRIQDDAAQLGRAVTDAFDAAQGLASALTTGIDTSGLEAAAAALGQLGGVDLTSIADAAASLDQATGPADQIAASLTQAADSADGIATASNVDPSGAEALAASLDQAAVASQAVGDGVQLELFAAAAADVDSLASGLTTAADAGREAADAADNVASSLSDAASAVDELAAGAADTGTQLSLFGDTQTRVTEAAQGTTEAQSQTNEKVREGVDVAALLGAEFARIQGSIGGLLGPMGRFAEQAVEAVSALEGVSGLATGGLAAGAAGLALIGSQFDQASDTITLATGKTGAALGDLQDSLNTALRSSAQDIGAPAGELASILGILSRDSGAAGDNLGELTARTAAFLKVTSGSVGDVRSLTQAMTSLGLGADQLTGFEDQLAIVTTHFGISLSSLLQQIKTAGPALSTFGFNPGQVAGLIGELDQAGLSVTRLIPGFTKLAQTASGEGKTAAEALNELIGRIRGAADSQSALNEVQGVFSGRVSAQFVNAVRNGTVDIDKLNAVLNQSPGTVSRMTTAFVDLGEQFGAIRDELLSSLGQAGLPFFDALTAGVAAIRPTLRELFDVIGALSPAFKGFAEAALAPIEALQFLETPLHLLADVLHLIPAPILETVGALAAFKLLPFGLIAQGLEGIYIGLARIAIGGVGAAVGGALTGIGEAIAAINPLVLIAGAGLVTLFTIMHQRSQDAEEMKTKVDALDKALGDLSIGAAEVGPKLDEALRAGSKGDLISDAQIASLAKAGLSLQQFRDLLQSTASAPEQDVTRTLRQSLLDASGGIQGLVDKFHNLPIINTGAGIIDLSLLADQTLKTADGQKKLTDEFLNQGTIAGALDPKLKAILSSFKEITAAADEDAKKQINLVVATTETGAADRQAALDKLGLVDATGNESRVLSVMTDIANEHTAAKYGLATADEKVDQATGAILDGLEKEGALQEQVAGATGQHAKVLNELAAASRNGAAANGDRIRITKELVASGVEEGDAIKLVAKAEKELADIQAKHTPVTIEFNNALRNTFEQIAHGTGEWQALSGAAQTFGVDIAQLEPAFAQLNSQLQKFAPPIQVGDDVMAQLIHDMRAGLPIQTTFSDLMAVTGGNTQVALAALDQYTKGVDATTKAVDNLVPSLGSVLSKLQDSQITFPSGVDEALVGQEKAILDSAKTSHDALDQQVKDIEAAKQARSDADQASIDAQKKALQDQKSLAQDAAKARGETFDSTAIDLQIQALKAHTDTSDLDAQLTAVQSKQKDIDAGLARAQAALATFDSEERAIRGAASLRDADIADQLTQLATARQLAVDTAAARGQAFDTSSFDKAIADLQTKRTTLAAETDQAVADAQKSGASVTQAVADAQGGLVGFGAVLDLFKAQMITKVNDAAIITELEAQHFGNIVKFLFDPQAGISDAERSQRLAAIATLSPEERQAFETQATAALAAEDAANNAVGGLGDLFAKPNEAAVNHANTRGQELAKGITDGFIKTLDDSKINEIIDLVIKTGVSPTDARKFVQDQVDAAKRAAGGPVTTTPGSLPSVGISADQVAGAEAALGVAGTTAGSLFLQNAQDAMKQGLDPDAATVMLQPVVDQLPRIGSDGGTTVAFEVDKAIKETGLDPDAAVILAENLRTQLPVQGNEAGAAAAIAVDDAIRNNPIDPAAAAALFTSLQPQIGVEGTTGGTVYATNIRPGIDANPIPIDEAFTVAAGAVGNVTTALGAEGYTGGKNYATGITGGINDNGFGAADAATVFGISVVAAGDAAMGNQSPSVKGRRSGALWVEGITLGIEAATPKATAAAEKMAFQVAATTIPVLDVPRLPDLTATAAKIAAAVPAPVVAQPALVGAGVGAGKEATSAGNVAFNGDIVFANPVDATAPEIVRELLAKAGWYLTTRNDG